MISWIQKTFHTDKWWGKAILIVLTYIIYWCVFYGAWIIITNNWQEADFNIYGQFISFSLIFLYIFLPILTFFIFPKFFKKYLIQNANFINLIFVILSLVLFYSIVIIRSLKFGFF